MNISPPLLVLCGCAALFVIGIVFVLVKLYLTTSELNKSFAKLGYVTREDAKKYFGDAAEKVVDMNSSFYQQYQRIIEDGVRKALSESGTVMEESIAKAQHDAGTIVVHAQANAQQILATAKQDSEQYYDRAVSEAASAMEWALEQYLKEHFDVHQHEQIIDKLLEAYINERRS